MSHWVLKRVIEFVCEVEADTRQEAIEAFTDIDARTRIIKETTFKNCRLATDGSILSEYAKALTPDGAGEEGDKMSPVYDSKDLKDLVNITVEGDVVGCSVEEHPEYGEYFHIQMRNVVIDPPVFQPNDPFDLRVKTSERKDSLWDDFVTSHKKLSVVLPDGIVGKRLKYERVRVRKGNFTGTGYRLMKVLGEVASDAVLSSKAAPSMEQLAQEALSLIEGKTNAQFIKAAALHPDISTTEGLLTAIKTGVFQQALVAEGKVELVEESGIAVYRRKV